VPHVEALRWRWEETQNDWSRGCCSK
jgi:hypothetical protein